MSHIEKSIEELEKKFKKLTTCTIILAVFFCVSVSINFIRLDVNSAQAQSGYVIAPPNVPAAVEAQSFILKDREGNIRGMWSAEEKSTTFATAYRRKQPFLSIKVDEDAATLTISDERSNQIFLTSSNTNGQSLAMGNINNPSHNVLLGFNQDETNLELVSRGSSRIGMSGREILIEALGKTTNLVIAEQGGQYINLAADSRGGKISFVDSGDYENIRIEHAKGESIITLISPAVRGRQIIKAAAGDLSEEERGKRASSLKTR